MGSLRRAAVVLSISLCGCTHYVKPGASHEQSAHDEAQCHREAELAAGSMRPGAERGVRVSDLTIACMERQGYTLRLR